jgi:transposase
MDPAYARLVEERYAVGAEGKDRWTGMEIMMTKLNHAGIEVSAKKLMVSMVTPNEVYAENVYSNTVRGRKALCKFLTRMGGITRAVLESTGVYSIDLAIMLHKYPGIEVMMVNPQASRNFSKALSNRCKNDRIDAEMLREFARRMEFVPFVPPSPHIYALRALSRKIKTIQEHSTKEKNRLKAYEFTKTSPREIIRITRKIIRNNVKANEVLTDAAMKIIRDDPMLHRKYELLVSIKGIAQTSAVQILGELAVYAFYLSAKQMVALAGLDPVEYQSGSSVNKRKSISKKGSRYLRHALYMPALVAIRHDPDIRAFYSRLIAKGKKPKVAVIAVMRKLLHAMAGMFIRDEIFDGAKLFQN